MSEKILLSFVIPVHNVEKYLNECLDSIFDPSADEEEYEVIAVDAGSTDSSPEILETYASHRHFRIITQKNTGPGGARNTGMKAAKGKYIYFVDSDDMLLRDTVPVLLDYARETDSDIVEFLGQTMDEKGNYIAEFQQARNMAPQSGTGKDVFVVWYEKSEFSPVVWIRIFNRAFLIKDALYFHEYIFQEDVEWVYRCFFYAKTVIFHPKIVYSYRRRQNSASTEKNDIKRCFDYIAVIDLLMEFRNSMEYNEENLKYIAALGDKIATLLDTAINIFCKSSSLSEYRRVIFNELKKRRFLLGLATRKKGRNLYRLTRFLPTRFAFQMYKIM